MGGTQRQKKPMKKPLIAGNWKMYKTVAEAVQLVQAIKAGVYKFHDVITVICPPFTALSEVSKELREAEIGLGAQNMHFETEGAYTGEVSPQMLKDLGCRYVILGHSERRTLFKETDALVQKKLKTALKYSLVPIVCVGESLQERESNRQADIVRQQLERSLADITEDEIAKVVIAYEPVWAIGAGKTASPEQAEEMHAFIRKVLSDKFGEETAQKLYILYGGSVKPDNIESLIEKPNVDGALVGGASLKAESFSQLVATSAATTKVGSAK